MVRTTRSFLRGRRAEEAGEDGVTGGFPVAEEADDGEPEEAVEEDEEDQDDDVEE